MNIKNKQSLESHGSGTSVRHNKVARLSSGASIGAAIVEAENSLEIDVCYLALGESIAIMTIFYA